MSFVYTY